MLYEFKIALTGLCLFVPIMIFYVAGESYQEDHPEKWTRFKNIQQKILLDAAAIIVIAEMVYVPTGCVRLIWGF